MAWFRKTKMGDVAWYRHRNYKGTLSEDQKVELDSIRWKSKSGQHPAAKFEDLPEEVQHYIVHLENEISDSKFSVSIISLLLGTFLMLYCAMIALNILPYSDVLPSIAKLSLISLALIVFGALDYRSVQKRWVEKDTNEELLKNWEIDYISRQSSSS